MDTLTIDKVGDKTRQSVKWSFMYQVFQKVFFFIGSVILARLLTPHDFGLATIVITFDMVIWIVTSMGLNSAIVHFQDHIEERLNATFWLFLMSSSVIVICLIIVSPYIAAFYKEPILKDIVKWSSLAIFISCLGSVQKTILVKNIEFKKIAILDGVISILKTSLYIIFAFFGFGVWSFIYPKVIIALVSVPVMWCMTGWRPKFKLYLNHWGEMFRYGKNVLLSSIIDYTLNNSSYILIGSLIGSTALGIYTFAYDKSMMVVNNITYPICIVSFSAFAKLQDARDRLKQAFFKTIKLIAVITFPCTFGQLVLGPEYITTVFGGKWHPSIMIFQMLLVYSMLRSVCQCGTAILQGVGKPHIVLRCNLAYAPLFFLSLYLGFKFDGVYGIGAATAIVGGIWSIIYMTIVMRTLEWSMIEVIQTLKASFISSLIMAGIIFILKDIAEYIAISKPVILLICIPFGILIYYLSIRILFKDTYDLIISNMSKFMGKKRSKLKDVFQKETIKET